MAIKKLKQTSVSTKEAIANVLNTLDEQDLDPIKELVLLVKDTTTSRDDKISILKTLASFVAPKRKAVDVNLDTEEGITVKIIKVNSPGNALNNMLSDAAKAEIEGTEIKPVKTENIGEKVSGDSPAT